MKIGIDYDATFTADPNFWRQVISLGQQMGHEFVCVTGRREPPGSHEPRLPDIPIVCAGQEWKRHAAAKAGHHVHIWIDDMPGMVEPTRILSWEPQP